MKDFHEFTNLYSLSKTLRFELKPIGEDGKPLSSEKANELFKDILEQDKKIQEAYIAVKPIMDKIHEKIITKSLSSKAAKEIDFSAYFEEYKKGKEKNLENFEKNLRKEIGELFGKTADEFANKEGKDENNEPIFKKKGIKCLTEAGILKYIEKNIEKLIEPDQNKKDFIQNEKGKKEIQRTGHLAVLDKFFTYFGTYNQNRENYYEYKKEAGTAVATRIVHENLPRFCDNLLLFDSEKTTRDKKTGNTNTVPSRKSEYLNAYNFLRKKGIDTKIKDAETDTMIEAYPIDGKMFQIQKFANCLTQEEIDAYNKTIGHYNLLINLYNQARRNEENFRKLPPFKILYKQIGSRRKKSLFQEIKYETKKERDNAKEKFPEPVSLEGTLELIAEAGKKLFSKNKNGNEVTIFTFIDWLHNVESWEGVYWSKATVDKISNRHLANWHDIKDRIQSILETGNREQKEILHGVASFDKKKDEEIKLKDAIELPGLFFILDEEKGDKWPEHFFKPSVLESYKSLINEKKSPSENLIGLICADIKNSADEFLKQYKDKISKIKDYKTEENILEIKKWLDTARSSLWLIKYFDVNQRKIQGNPMQPELASILDVIFRNEEVDWFNWYNLVRNYLTKKPQEEVKENKLKLNFGKGNLLNALLTATNPKEVIMVRNMEDICSGKKLDLILRLLITILV